MMHGSLVCTRGFVGTGLGISIARQAVGRAHLIDALGRCRDRTKTIAAPVISHDDIFVAAANSTQF